MRVVFLNGSWHFGLRSITLASSSTCLVRIAIVADPLVYDPQINTSGPCQTACRTVRLLRLPGAMPRPSLSLCVTSNFASSIFFIGDPATVEATTATERIFGYIGTIVGYRWMPTSRYHRVSGKSLIWAHIAHVCQQFLSKSFFIKKTHISLH